MHRLLFLPLVALAACALDIEPVDAVAVAPALAATLEAPVEEPAALSRRATRQSLVAPVWGGKFDGARGDVARTLGRERYAANQPIWQQGFLCSRATTATGERIVALNLSYSDLQDAGETCWSRIVSGGSGDWLEIAPTAEIGKPTAWERATTLLPQTGTLVGLAGQTTITASFKSTEDDPRLTVEGWTTDGRHLWKRQFAEQPGWPQWTADGLLSIYTQSGTRFAAARTLLDPTSGDVVTVDRIDPRLQQIITDPWALVACSRTSEWSSDRWPANRQGELASDAFRVEHDTDFYLKYDVHDVATGERVWGKSINPGKHTRTLFAHVEGPWLLVSIVSGSMVTSEWRRSQTPLEIMKAQADGIEVRAYELGSGKPVGTWNYKLDAPYSRP